MAFIDELSPSSDWPRDIGDDPCGFRYDSEDAREFVNQFETLRFVSDSAGQQRKVKALNWLSSRGWRILGETIETGHMKGDQACCLATLCLPLAFMAGRTPNVTVVSIERDISHALVSEIPHQHEWVRFDDNRIICAICETMENRRFGT